VASNHLVANLYEVGGIENREPGFQPERPVLADTPTRSDWQSIWHEDKD